MSVKAIIFDMDGVITDTMPFHFQAWKEVFQTQGIAVTHEDIYSREGQKGRDSVREIFTENNVNYSETLADHLLKDKEERFKRIFVRKFIPGSRALIKILKEQGYLLGLVTGTSRTEAQKLLPKALFNTFDVTVCGTDVVHGKPHPEPYLKAIKELGILPLEGIVIENAPFGIKAAKAAGLKCIAIETSLPKNFLKEADAVFHSFKEIKKYLQLEYALV